MFYYQTFFPLQTCSSLHCSQQIPEEKIGGHRARLREKENLFRYQAQFEGNLLSFARARAYLRTLMTRKSCAVGMRNAILRNYLKRASGDIYFCIIIVYILSSLFYDKNRKIVIGWKKKLQVKACTKPLLWDANDCKNSDYTNALCLCHFKFLSKFYNVPMMLDTFLLSSFYQSFTLITYSTGRRYWAQNTRIKRAYVSNTHSSAYLTRA